MYEDRLVREKLDFMKKYSICPDDGAVPSDGKSFTLIMITESAKLKSGFELVKRTGAEKGALHLRLVDGGKQPIYFLPWLTHHIVGMSIPIGGPDVFFTAAINGCSVFITGDPASPTVYHAGIGTDLNENAFKEKGSPTLSTAAKKKDAPLFWRLLLKKLVPLVAIDGSLGEVNKTHYVKDGTVGAFDRGQTTKRADAFDDFLRKKHKNLGINLVLPWGCVFGFRDGGAWKFYLQENCTAYFKGGKNATSLPMAITQVFPADGGKHNIIHQRWEGIENPLTLSDTVVKV
jgi:hypothetical protein